MNNLDIWQYLTEQPQTREHLEGIYPASILRNMRRSKHLVAIDGLYHAGKQPQKKWASNAERNAFYSMQWQRKMQADQGEKGKAFRAKRAKKKSTRPVKEKPVKVVKVKPERVFVHKPPKPVKPRSISLEPRKLGITEAKPEAVRLPCSDTFIKENPHLHEVLPAGRWSTSLRFDYVP